VTAVVAVVVHWRSVVDTLACVESLFAQPGIDVIVVDNGSTDPLAEMLSGRHVTLVRAPVNRGYAGGGNLGMRAALERGAETVLLLNDDTRLLPGANDAARRMLAADPAIAAVGPKVLLREDPQRLWLAWGELTWRQSLVGLRGAGEPDGPAFTAERDVPWIAGCAMWLRAGALRAIGLLDEEFFAYHEEVDWCTRARAVGWRVVYCPAARVTHTGRGTGGGSASIRVRKYFAARNAVLFARKHGNLAQQLKLGAFLAATLPLQLLWHWSRGTSGEVVLKMQGVRDALLGRRPPFERLGLR
jgi:GT2 family glycosyltransferase